MNVQTMLEMRDTTQGSIPTVNVHKYLISQKYDRHYPHGREKEQILFTLATAAEFFSSSPPTDILCQWMSIAISQAAHGDKLHSFSP